MSVTKTKILLGGLAAIAILFVAWTTSQGVFVKRGFDKEVTNCLGASEDTNDRIACLEKVTQKVLGKEGLLYGLRFIEEWSRKDVFLSAYCHAFVHLVGEYGYWDYYLSGELTVNEDLGICSFGYFHGFMQEFGHHGREFAEEAPALCSEFERRLADKLNIVHRQCNHGMGHGIIFNLALKHWPDDLLIADLGVRQCEEMFPGGDEPLRDCLDGVYAGVATFYFNTHGYHIPLDLDASDALAVCQRQPEVYKDRCYSSMVPIVATLSRYDLVKAVGVFTQSENDHNWDRLVNYLSMVVTRNKILVNEPLEALVEVCATFLTEYKAACIRGIGEGVFTYSLPENAVKKAALFCSLSENTEVAKNCFEGLWLGVSQNLVPEEVAAICEEYQNELGEYCKNEI